MLLLIATWFQSLRADINPARGTALLYITVLVTSFRARYSWVRNLRLHEVFGVWGFGVQGQDNAARTG